MNLDQMLWMERGQLVCARPQRGQVMAKPALLTCSELLYSQAL